MKIQHLDCENYRGFRGVVPFDFAEQINVFYGENGAGKSTVLDALATLLSWVVNRIRTPNANGSPLSEFDIHNKEHHASLTFRGRDSRYDCEFVNPLIKHRRGYLRNGKPPVRKLKELIGRFHALISTDEGGIPMLAYYPINRAVVDVPIRIRKKHDFSLLETYDQSLTRAANFRLFFEWFREREDLENEKFRWKGEKPSDRQLQSVRRAIESFMPGFSNLRICRKPQGMEVNKNGQTLRIEQLSSGEQCLMAMVGDIARRLAIANPKNNPLHGAGIVLIDEIELHLHPSWQRMILGLLLETFPNVQFFVSTHSPQVIGEVHANANGQRIFRLRQTEEGIRYTTPKQAYGLDSNLILDSMMTSDKSRLSQNSSTSEKLRVINRLVDREKFAEARKKIRDLEEELHGEIPETVGASALIQMLDDGETEDS